MKSITSRSFQIGNVYETTHWGMCVRLMPVTCQWLTVWPTRPTLVMIIIMLIIMVMMVRLVVVVMTDIDNYDIRQSHLIHWWPWPIDIDDGRCGKEWEKSSVGTVQFSVQFIGHYCQHWSTDVSSSSIANQTIINVAIMWAVQWRSAWKQSGVELCALYSFIHWTMFIETGVQWVTIMYNTVHWSIVHWKYLFVYVCVCVCVYI